MTVLDREFLRRECLAGQDTSYAMTASRSESTWSTIQAYLSTTPPTHDSLHNHIFRFAQVSFAHGRDIQTLAVRSGIHRELVRYVPVDADLSFKALSNLITRHEEVMDEVLPAVLDSLQVKAMRGRVSTYAFLFLRNALYFTQSERQSDRCRRVLESGLVLHLLLEDDDNDATMQSGEDEESLRFALSVGIMDTLFQEGFAQDCIALATLDATLDDRQQCVARRKVYKYLDQYTFQDKQHANVPFVLVTECRTRVDELAARLEDNPTSTHYSDERKVEWTSVALLISALAALLSQESAVPLLRLTAIQQVVAPAIKALGLAHAHFPRSKGGRITIVESGFELPNFKRDCITIISNLAHGNRHVQDSVRTLGGLPLVLGQCNIDELNPYLREHAMYCIRNLLDDNKENQDVVDSIKPVGVEQSSELSDLGYSAELKDGKIGVSRTAKIESINEE